MSLKDENRRLREYIAASEHCQAAQRLIELEEEHAGLRERLREFFDKIKGGLVVNVGSCCWCNEIWPNPAGDLDAIRALATAHDSQCTQNPMRLEIELLRKRLREVGGQP